MKGYLGNGSSAPAVYAVFIGEATCSGGNVSAVAAYAYNGRYEGAYVQNMPANVTLASANHNIGVVPKHVDFRAQITTTVGGWAVGEEFGFGSFFTNDGINPYSVPAIAADAKTVSTITSTGWTVCNKTTAAAQALSTQAKRRFIADRGW